MSRQLIRTVGAMVALTLAIAPAATAAEPTPTLTLGTGADPAESIATQLVANGTTISNATVLSATIRPTGGPECGANFAADEGAGGISVFNGSGEPEGPFSASVNHTLQTAGTYLLCAWLNDNTQPSSPVVASASLTFAVRPPHLALSLSAPVSVAPEQIFQLVTNVQAEAERPLSEFLLPDTGRGCPANAAAAVGSAGESTVVWPTHGSTWIVSGGPFSESVNETFHSPGRYLVCAYLQYPSTQSVPELSAGATITVLTPLPPCVVPTLSVAVKPNTAKLAITAAGCAVGKIRLVASRHIRAGYVVSLNPAPTGHYPTGTPVAITISTGPPCVVPHIAPGASLARTKAKLGRANCAVGALHKMKSRRYRHGQLVRLGARAGQVLPSRAPVAIFISRGPR